MVETSDRRQAYKELSKVYATLVTIAQRKGLQFSSWCKPYWFKIEGRAIEVRLPDGRNTTGYEVISRNHGDDSFGYELAASYEKATNISFTFIRDGPETRIEQRDDDGRIAQRQAQRDLSNRV